jgi:uncharacterized integral membrane protein
MKSVRHWIAIYLGACLIILALQNISEVEVQFLLLSFTAHRFMIILVSCLIGLVIGWLLKSQAVKRVRRKAQNAQAS